MKATETAPFEQSILNGSRFFLRIERLNEPGIQGSITALYFGDNGELVDGTLVCPTQGVVYGHPGI